MAEKVLYVLGEHKIWRHAAGHYPPKARPSRLSVKGGTSGQPWQCGMSRPHARILRSSNFGAVHEVNSFTIIHQQLAAHTLRYVADTTRDALQVAMASTHRAITDDDTAAPSTRQEHELKNPSMLLRALKGTLLRSNGSWRLTFLPTQIPLAASSAP